MLGVLKWSLAGVALFVASGAIAVGIVRFAGGHASAQVPPIERKGFGDYEQALADELNISVETLAAARKAAMEEVRPAGRRPDLGAWGQTLADELGISVEALEEAKQAAFEQALDEAVSSGRLTEEQAERLKNAGPAMRGGFPGLKPGIAKAAGLGVFKAIHNVVAETAEILDLSVEELREQWTSGKSLADIAAENGVDRDELKTQLVAAIEAEIDAAQSDGRLTAEQAERLSDALEEHIDKAIDHEGGLKMEGGPGFFKHGDGPRPGPGFMR